MGYRFSTWRVKTPWIALPFSSRPAMLQVIEGNILESRCAALVNPVNCVGVMGRGLALEFKQRFPVAFTDYADACKAKRLVPGKVLVSYVSDQNPRWVVQFPTKQHWSRPSRMDYIEDGLISLVQAVRLHAVESIAIPALGCGLGGLSWHLVRRRIEDAMAPLDGLVEVELYSPAAKRA
jgi:O-acetyl-ADP-ribose deacetylase (regulator of RNase III)